MTPLYPVRVLSVAPEADTLFDLHLEVGGSPVAGSHARPGQYAMLSLDGHETMPFAIASAPGTSELEFLVREGSPLSDALSKMSAGQTVLCSRAEGPGFPLERAKGRNVLLFATGSGISAIRSTLLTIRRERSSFKDVTLYFGARTPESFAYMDEHGEWEADRIRVVRTVSRPGESGWTGLTGYVQHHLQGVGAQDEVVFLCGQPEMVSGVTLALLKSGVAKENVFLNV